MPNTENWDVDTPGDFFDDRDDVALVSTLFPGSIEGRFEKS